MATITKTMKQDAIDTASGFITHIREAATRAGADRALGSALAISNYAQVWSLITLEDAQFLRESARRTFAKTLARLDAEDMGEL